MKTISYSRFEKFHVLTLTKESLARPLLEGKNNEFRTTEKGKTFTIWAHDEIPFVYYVPTLGLFGGTTINKEEALSNKVYHLMQSLIKDNNLDPSLIYCYLGPALTFSHFPLTHNEASTFVTKGCEAAVKGNNTATFFYDPQMMNLLQLRKIGIPFLNITMETIDTFECEPILYSALRGDKEKNPTIIKLDR